VDGAGTWNTTGTNWSNGTADAAWNNTSDSSYTAVFGANNGTAGTVTLGSNITAGGLTFNPATSSNYTIAGSGSYGLTLTGSSVVVNTNATLVANTTFANGLNLTGGQQLTLSGNNINTTGTTVTAGTLQIVQPSGSSSQNFSAPLGTGAVTVDTGAVLALNSNNGSGNLSNNIIITGNVNNGFGVANSNGALQFTGNNQTYTDTGNITLNSSNTTQTQIFNLGINSTVNFNGVIGGTVGQLNFFGQSDTNNEVQTFNLNNLETYTGNTNISTFGADTLLALKGGTNTLPTGTTLTLSPSSFGTVGTSGQGPSTLTLDLAGNNQSITGLNINTLNNSAFVTIEDSTGNHATLTVGSAGVGSLSLANDTININTNLNATGAANFASASAGSVVNVNAIFNTPFYFDVGNNNGATTININNGGTITNTGEYLFTYGGGAGSTMNVNVGGIMDAFQIRLGNNANAVLNLNGGLINTDLIHTNYSGGGTLNLNGGTLEAAGVGPIQNPWLESTTTDPLTVNVLNNGVTIEVPTNITANVTAAFLQGSSTSTGGISITGGGTLTLLGTTNTYTGPTSINAGTLTLGMNDATAATIADSSMLTINSGATFDISAITATSTTLKGLTISGGTINVAMDGSGNVSNIVLNSAAIVSGTNTINFAAASGVTALTPGTYTLLADASGGLTGTFLFGNGTNSEKYILGSDSYMLSLENTNTAETLNVGAGAPVPEPATLCMVAMGGLGLLLVGRKRTVRRNA
jgi:autotransporter-associated beta strand protein